MLHLELGIKQKRKSINKETPLETWTPSPLTWKKKSGIFLAFLTPSHLPKIRKSEHFLGEFQKPNLAILNHNQSGYH